MLLCVVYSDRVYGLQEQYSQFHPDNPLQDDVEEFMSESAIMLDFDHPNVLKLLGVCFDAHDDFPLIILPYMANGDLKTFLVNKRGNEEIDVLPKVVYVNN